MRDTSVIFSPTDTPFLIGKDTVQGGSFFENVIMDSITSVTHLPQSVLAPIIGQQQFVWIAIVCLLFLSSYLAYLQGGMVWLKPSMISDMCRPQSSFFQTKRSIRLTFVLVFQYAFYSALILYPVSPFKGIPWMAELGVLMLGVLSFVFLQCCALSLFSYLFFPTARPERIGAASFVAFLYMGQFLLIPALLVWFSPKSLVPVLYVCFIFYVIVRFLLILGLVNGFFSKKFRLLALFLYLCAFEIAPIYFIVSRYFF